MLIDPKANQVNHQSGVKGSSGDAKLDKAEKLRRIAARNNISGEEAKKLKDLNDSFYQV